MQIPSPVDRVNHPVFEEAGITCFMKREDQIHPIISGNKWRKLKYNVAHLKRVKKRGFITFGGAFSNHLAASAFAAKKEGLQMVAVVRGDEQRANATLNFVQSCGAEVKRVSRQEYAKKEDDDFLAMLRRQYPNLEIIPEGGANVYGVRGCTEILHEVTQPFDVVACPMGSATTFAGLVLSGKHDVEFMGFPAIKGGNYLSGVVDNFVAQARTKPWLPASFIAPQWQLQTDYHFGGFGKISPQLVAFMNTFWAETNIPLDPIYTAKMMYGLIDLAKRRKFKSGTRLLVLHTGGLQGIKGMNVRLRKKNLELVYEEAISAAFTYPHF